MAVNVFIIVVSLVLGLIILAALIWCLWKVRFTHHREYYYSYYYY